MSARTGADLLLEALEQYGVTHVFGNPGTTELPVVKAITESPLEYILGLHEDVAVGMAAGYAQTRRYHADSEESILPLGVVNLHLAPGLAHGLGNLYNASMTGAPLLVTAGNHSRGFRHEEPILSGDLKSMAEQFTKYSAEVLDVEALPTMLRRAVRVALTPPTGPVFLALPLDVMQSETGLEPERLGAIPTAGGGDPNAMDAVVEVLVDADEPVFVLGDGVARAGRQAVEAAVDFAESTGARVHGEALGCEVNFPGEHDQWVSHLPPREGSLRSLMNTDLLVFVGTSTNTTVTAHDQSLIPTDATTVYIGDDAWEIGKNHPADVAVLGDPGTVMSELATQVTESLPQEAREKRLERVESTRKRVQAIMRGNEEGDEKATLASKAQLVEALRETVPNARIVDEGITSKYVMLSHWPFEAEQYLSNKGGGLGYGLPAAVGAALAESQQSDPRDVLGFVGDGSYLYYPNAIYSAARYDLDLTVVVPDNRNYRILKENAAGMFEGDPESIPLSGVDFDPPVDIPANAESHGATGRLVKNPEAIEGAVREGVETDGPVVLDVLVHD